MIELTYLQLYLVMLASGFAMVAIFRAVDWFFHLFTKPRGGAYSGPDPYRWRRQ